MAVDVLAIGAHPDDVELGVGGLMALCASQGLSTAILDLTRGEMSSRGTPKEREHEAAAAAKILSVSDRENAHLPDGGIQNTQEQQRILIPILRRLAPRVLMTHHHADRHPDHRAAHDLVRDANYFAGLSAIEGEDPPHRASELYYFHPYYQGTEAPSIVIDVSEHMETKLEALRAHKSQFHNPDYGGTETMVSSSSFWEGIRTRAAFWGNSAGVPYAEALYIDGPVKLNGLPGVLPKT